MATRSPFLRIAGPNGEDLVDRLGEDLVGVQVSDFEVGQSDQCVIRIRRRKPWRLPPARDTRFEVHFGWESRSAVMAGAYLFQRITLGGDPETGQEMGLVCRAADYTDALKRVDSEHLDEETGHRTYGDVFQTMAERAGLSAAIDPEIAKIPLAGGYILRWKQSVIGFATDIGEEIGALVKPQAGRLVVRQPNGFRSPTGQSLTPVRILYDPNYAFQADIEPRYGFSEVSASWFDTGKGRPVEVLKQLGRGAARFALPHVAGSQALADIFAGAAAQRLEAISATALFQSAGQPDAVAGAPVVPVGFGPEIDGVNWAASAVHHDVEPAAGWVTTIETRNAR